MGYREIKSIAIFGCISVNVFVKDFDVSTRNEFFRSVIDLEVVSLSANY